MYRLFKNRQTKPKWLNTSVGYGKNQVKPDDSFEDKMVNMLKTLEKRK